MVVKPVRLNKKQADVLVWIRNGCPDGIFVSGYEHRIVARALEQRGLVDIKGRGPSWSATVTETGREWQDVSPPDEDVPTVEAAADRLIAEVLGAGGSLPLPEGRDAEKTHEQLVRRSLKSSIRPKGKKLEIVRKGPWGQGPGAIVFTEHFDDYVDAVPVPVPERVSRYHPAVKAFIQNKEWQYVTGEHVPRAGRVLQALANEASNRGIEALRPQDAARHSKDPGKMHLALRTRAGAYLLQIREISGPGTQRMSRRLWNEPQTNPAWMEARGWEFSSTGRLELVVHGPGTPYDGAQYRDTRTGTLEEKLPEVFRSLEIYRLRAEWAEQEHLRKKEERRRAWETAMAAAKEQYVEHAHWEHFTEKSRTWASINQHRSFLDAARKAAESHAGTNRDAVLQQLDHAERTLEAIDPIRQLSLLVLEVPNPGPEDLKPFLGRWNPYGPDGGHGL